MADPTKCYEVEPSSHGDYDSSLHKDIEDAVLQAVEGLEYQLDDWDPAEPFVCTVTIKPRPIS